MKTVGFQDGKYVGDPLNAVRIFNEKEVDELFVLDIDATREGRTPNLDLVRRLAAECRMPLCYGGGVRDAHTAEALVSLGVEKVAIGAAAIEVPGLIEASAERLGSQSIVGVVDARRKKKGYEAVIRNGTKATGQAAPDLAGSLEKAGAGEIMLNSVDRDGTMEGYDLDLIARVRAAITIPMTVVGGAANLDDAGAVFHRFGPIGASAGSLFVFKGRYRAVLINYPNRAEKDRLTGVLS